MAQKMGRIDSCLTTVLVTGWDLQEDDPRLLVFDFKIQKPFGDLDRVLNTIAQAVELHDVRVEEKENLEKLLTSVRR